MRLRLCFVVVALMAPWAGIAHGQPAAMPKPKVLAKIGDFSVTDKYLSNIVENRFAREIMEEIVRDRVIDAEATTRGVRISQDQVNDQIAREKSGFPSDEAFLSHAQSMGLTPKGYRERVRTHLQLEALMGPGAEVTEADAKAYWETHKSEFSAEPQLHLRDLVSASQEDSLLAFRALAAGTPPDAVARRYGTPAQPGTAGDLGWVTGKSIPIKGLWEPAAALKEGEIGPPVELEGQFHIIQLLGWRAGDDFDAVKDDIKAKLQPQRGASEEEFVNDLLAKAKIQVLWPPTYYLNDEYQLLKGARIYVDERLLRLTPPPTVAGATLVAPLKPVLQAVDAAVLWQAGTKSMQVKRGETTLVLTVGQPKITVNGAEKDLSTAPILKGSTLFAPVADVLQALGLKADWKADTQVLRVSTAAVQ